MSDLGARLRSIANDLPYADTEADRTYLASLLDNAARDAERLAERLSNTENSLEQAANGMKPW